MSCRRKAPDAGQGDPAGVGLDLYLLSVMVVLHFTLGNSQTMKAAWAYDSVSELLEFKPWYSSNWLSAG